MLKSATKYLQKLPAGRKSSVFKVEKNSFRGMCEAFLDKKSSLNNRHFPSGNSLKI